MLVATQDILSRTLKLSSKANNLSKVNQMELCACGCGYTIPTVGEIPEYNGELYAYWECVEHDQELEFDAENSL